VPDPASSLLSSSSEEMTEEENISNLFRFEKDSETELAVPRKDREARIFGGLRAQIRARGLLGRLVGWSFPRKCARNSSIVPAMSPEKARKAVPSNGKNSRCGNNSSSKLLTFQLSNLTFCRIALDREHLISNVQACEVAMSLGEVSTLSQGRGTLHRPENLAWE
jgi:hypothetical protein